MHTENSVVIHASQERLFSLAADIQRWQEILPHYRYVRVLDQNTDGTRKVVEMAAIRADFPARGISFPVTWRSVQVCDRASGQIYFKHLAGIAQGMWVVWTFVSDPDSNGVRVTISHDLRYPFSLLNGWFARNLVGQKFVQSIAGRTLATLKTLAEEECVLERKLS